MPIVTHYITLYNLIRNIGNSTSDQAAAFIARKREKSRKIIISKILILHPKLLPPPSIDFSSFLSCYCCNQCFFKLILIIDMRIKDTSLVYSYSISVCMGSFVFGYELTSFGNLNDLIVSANTWKDQQEIDQALLLLSSVLSLAAIFGKLPLI